MLGRGASRTVDRTDRALERVASLDALGAATGDVAASAVVHLFHLAALLGGHPVVAGVLEAILVGFEPVRAIVYRALLHARETLGACHIGKAALVLRGAHPAVGQLLVEAERVARATT